MNWTAERIYSSVELDQNGTAPSRLPAQRVCEEPQMMTLSDCASLCVLDPEDIEAIAACGNTPGAAAATLAGYLANAAGRTSTAISWTMIGDIRTALGEGCVYHASDLVMALCQFLDENPQARPNLTIH